MPKLSLKEIKSIPRTKLLKLINALKTKIKKHKVIIDAFDKYKVDLDEMDDIPVCFSDIPVSARTDHGIIFLNYSLLEDGSIMNDDHYLVHEVIHYLQQCTGSKPTSSSDGEDYLDNKFEQEGFQNQIKYIEETRDKETANDYVNQVLDHHEIKGKEREEKKKELTPDGEL